MSGQSVTLTMPVSSSSARKTVPLRGHRVLPGHDQPADAHPSRRPLRQLAGGHRRPADPAPAGTARSPGAARRATGWRSCRPGVRARTAAAGRVPRSAGSRRSRGRPASGRRRPRAPRVAPATSRSCHSSSRRGRPSESSAPARISRSTTSSDRSVRATRSASERYGPRSDLRVERSPSSSPMPLTRCRPRRMP